MKLAFIFESATPPGMHVLEHTHEVLEFVYYKHGCGTSEINGEVHDVCPGVFTITPSGLSHNQINKTQLISVCLGLKRCSLERFTGAWSDLSGEIGLACRKLIEEASQYGIINNHVFTGLLLQVVALAERHVVQAHPLSRQDLLVAQAGELVRQHAGRMTVAQLASALNVSSSHLRHLFAEFSDQSPSDLITRTRLEHAMALLSDPKRSIQEIAFQCGFSSPYYFSRFFKKEMGAPPSQIRDHITGSDKN